jgi:predicted permease
MAQELGGDTEIASSVVTLSTLISPLTYILWALVLGIG